MLYTTLDNFYLGAEQLEANSPSRKDGITLEDEEQLRRYGAERIQRGGIYLRL